MPYVFAASSHGCGRVKTGLLQPGGAGGSCRSPKVAEEKEEGPVATGALSPRTADPVAWTDIKDASELGIRGHLGCAGTPESWALSNSKWPWQSKCPHHTNKNNMGTYFCGHSEIQRRTKCSRILSAHVVFVRVVCAHTNKHNMGT